MVAIAVLVSLPAVDVVLSWTYLTLRGGRGREEGGWEDGRGEDGWREDGRRREG